MARTDDPRVLLVDDNEATCALITAVLRRDFNIEVCGDGADAIERLRTNTYAAILLDLRLPVIDGYGVLDFIRKHSPEVLRRVIVVTASVTKGDLERVSEFSVSTVLSKPFEVESLQNAVKACAGPGGSSLGNVLSSGVILLIADLLSHRFL